MNQPVTYLEIHSAAFDASRDFFVSAFGWDPQPFAAPDYLVAPHGDGAGVDSALLPSRDGASRVVPVINVGSIPEAVERATNNGGIVVVDVFTIPGVGRGCYLTDPSGLLIGLHENDPEA